MNKPIHHSNRMSKVIATDVLEQAFASVYQKRRKDSANSDIWSLSLHWASIKKTLQIDLLAGTYQYFNERVAAQNPQGVSQARLRQYVQRWVRWSLCV